MSASINNINISNLSQGNITQPVSNNIAGVPGTTFMNHIGVPASVGSIVKTPDGLKTILTSSNINTNNNQVTYAMQNINSMSNGNLNVGSASNSTAVPTSIIQNMVSQSFPQSGTTTYPKLSTSNGTTIVIKNSNIATVSLPTQMNSSVAVSRPNLTSAVSTVNSNNQQNVHYVNLRTAAPSQTGNKVPQRFMMAAPNNVVRAGPNVFPLGGNNTQQLLVKTENGQYHLVRLANSTTTNNSSTPSVQSVGSFRPALPASGSTASTAASTIQASMAATTTVSSPTPVQRSSDNSKEKCRKFLTNLIDLSTKEPMPVRSHVLTLIQDLIDGNVEPTIFCERLEKLLNASPQPCLIGFLKRSLPSLKTSMANREMFIEGINPPSSNKASSVPISTPTIAQISNNQVRPGQLNTLQQVRIALPSTSNIINRPQMTIPHRIIGPAKVTHVGTGTPTGIRVPMSGNVPVRVPGSSFVTTIVTTSNLLTNTAITTPITPVAGTTIKTTSVAGAVKSTPMVIPTQKVTTLVPPTSNATAISLTTSTNAVMPTTTSTMSTPITGRVTNARQAGGSTTKKSTASSRSAAAKKTPIGLNNSGLAKGSNLGNAAKQTVALSKAAAAQKEKERKAAVAAAATLSNNVAVAATATATNSSTTSASSTSAGGFVGEDDVNDVAAMAGVNLEEEKQRILGPSEFVGTQIRSCKDETFLHTHPLTMKIQEIVSRNGLDNSGSDVVALISHAAQEQLRTLIEKLDIVAEHRIDFNKMDKNYEVTHDVRSQLVKLCELDKAERKKHDELEREIMLRAAKSRSKTEDPEQLLLKAKAKEIQRIEIEELRQQEANSTALAAIGPRKRKLDAISNQLPGGSNPSTQPGGNRLPIERKRTKRVSMRDFLYVMEKEKSGRNHPLLYKAYLK